VAGTEAALAASRHTANDFIILAIPKGTPHMPCQAATLSCSSTAPLCPTQSKTHAPTQSTTLLRSGTPHKQHAQIKPVCWTDPLRCPMRRPVLPYMSAVEATCLAEVTRPDLARRLHNPTHSVLPLPAALAAAAAAQQQQHKGDAACHNDERDGHAIKVPALGGDADTARVLVRRERCTDSDWG